MVPKLFKVQVANMKTLWIPLCLCLLFQVVMLSDQFSDVSTVSYTGEQSEESSTDECTESRYCEMPIPYSSQPDSPDVDDGSTMEGGMSNRISHTPTDVPSYLALCQKFHLRMEKLESEHPEIKEIKIKLTEKLTNYASEFELELASKDGETLIFKIFKFMEFIVDELKADFEKILHDKKEMDDDFKKILPDKEIDDFEDGILMGSIKGIPGIHFPNYKEIPITSFDCHGRNIPGFYADVETGCQVFHVCYEHRRESFLCPIGMIFNQPILACDYWYSSDCTKAPKYFDKDDKFTNLKDHVLKDDKMVDFIENLFDGKKAIPPAEVQEIDTEDLLKFLPVKSKVVEFPEVYKPVQKQIVPPVTFKDVDTVADGIFDDLVGTGIHVTSKARQKLAAIPEPEDKAFVVPPVYKPFPNKDKLSAKAFASVPIMKTKKIASVAKLATASKLVSAAAVPAAKAIFSAPIAKAKVASAAAIPAAKLKMAAVPVVKAKAASAAAAAAIPAAKLKMAAVPIVKAKAASASAAAAAAIPAAKLKMAAVPIVKAKAASAAAAAAIPAAKLKMAAVPIVKAKAASAQS
ncbi:chitin-binding type-2 domain-containing protein [Caerostris darwini]|uniref:Chitin-binding type-2 domain-containing protein n=1 Tax=Caerostris darwini TaxID=1538125 RepID=A0AAV4NK52_9ARAC|nr:chitin-binding type-2 domain-containing protein [Caerostris darwini]